MPSGSAAGGVPPLVSVVMPSLNQARFLEQALRSVLEQSHRRLELIVADGGSGDGTLELLQQWQARDARVRFFSEPDTGPADALNKALARVRGTVVGWLNADDEYTPGAVERTLQALHSQPHWALVYGHGEHMDEAGKPLAPYPTLPPHTPLERFNEGCFICQPTVFFKRTVPLLLGPLDESLKTAFDFDYWLRAFGRLEGRIGFVDALQARSRLHDQCITRRARMRVTLEGMQVLWRHQKAAPGQWLLSYLEELLADPKARGDAGALDGHMAQMLEQARPWLDPLALPHLQQQVARRLQRDRT